MTSNEHPDPRVRGVIPTLTEVVDRIETVGPFTRGDEVPDEVPDEVSAETADETADEAAGDSVDDGRSHLGQSGRRFPDAAEASDAQAILAQLGPQIEDMLRDAMRDAQVVALARVRMLLRERIEALLPKTEQPSEPEPGPGHDAEHQTRTETQPFARPDA